MKDLLKRIEEAYMPPTRQLVWEWAAENLDYSRSPAYECELKAPYDPEYMPYWKEPAACLNDRSIREVIVCKCSRAGCSENVLLNSLRYTLAVAPVSTLYISGDEKSTQNFFERRIKLGFGLALATRKKLARARQRENEIFFEDMDLKTTWPKNRQAFKQSGYGLIIADEYDTWPAYSADMMDKRVDNYAFPTIFKISSPDPAQKRSSKDSPIFVDFERGDQRYWYVRDPGSRGRWFKFEMGSSDLPYGLKWDQRARRTDGTWDLDLVRSSAHYIAPSGHVIKNSQRMRMIRKGKWIAENPNAPKRVRSYHLNNFYIPFESGDFGAIAVAFLNAKHKSAQALRIFTYEYLAEKWADNVERTDDEALVKRCRDYGRGEKPFTDVEPWKSIYIQKPKAVITGVDVQQGHLWMLAEEYVQGGDSGVVDYKYGITWEDVEDFADRYGSAQIMVDYGYAKRRLEVLQESYARQMIPTKGANNLVLPFKKTYLDPFEGTSKQGEGSVATISFNTDIFKMMRLDAFKGESEKAWYLYQYPEHDLVSQLSSEERIDGVWQTKRGHPNNHLFDCSVLCLLGAVKIGIYRSEFMMPGV